MNTASITTAVIVIHFMPTIAFALAVTVASSVASSVVATYDKKAEKGS
jgi:hypothetical protein